LQEQAERLERWRHHDLNARRDIWTYFENRCDELQDKIRI
jgi:hypothetical protein